MVDISAFPTCGEIERSIRKHLFEVADEFLATFPEFVDTAAPLDVLQQFCSTRGVRVISSRYESDNDHLPDGEWIVELSSSRGATLMAPRFLVKIDQRLDTSKRRLRHAARLQRVQRAISPPVY